MTSIIDNVVINTASMPGIFIVSTPLGTIGIIR